MDHVVSKAISSYQSKHNEVYLAKQQFLPLNQF